MRVVVLVLLLTACDSKPFLHTINCLERATAVHVSINYLPLAEVKGVCSGHLGCYVKWTGQVYVPEDYHQDYILAHELDHASCKTEA